LAKEPVKLIEKLQSWGFTTLPTFDPNDYGRPMVGLAEDLNFYVNRLEREATVGKRHGTNWVKEHGFGKSTFLYNVCDFVNRNYFLKPISEPTMAKYSRILAIYVPFPSKLDEVVRRLLSASAYFPSVRGRPEIGYKSVLSILAYQILLEANRRNPALDKVSTIEQAREVIEKDPKTKSDAIAATENFLEQHLPFTGKKKKEIKAGIKQLFYPIDSAEFENGMQILRNRLSFESLALLLRFARVFLLLVADQVEYLTLPQLKDLIKIATSDDQFGHIHLATVWRADWQVWVKPDKIKDYNTLMYRLEDQRLGALSMQDGQELVGSVLDEFRSREASLPDRFHPVTEKALKYLLNKSKDPLVHNEVHPRRLLNLVTQILSLAYRRCDTTITAKLLQSEAYEQLILRITETGAVETEAEAEREKKIDRLG